MRHATAAFSGLHLEREKFADSPELWRALAAQPDQARHAGISPESARQNLLISERFGDETFHARSVFHQVQVCEYTPCTWNITRTAARPCGALRPVAELRFPDALYSEPPVIRVLERNITVRLPDGQIVRGDKVEVAPFSGLSGAPPIPNPFFEIHFDKSQLPASGDYYYSFKIKRDAVTAVRPLAFIVTTEVRINDEPLSRAVETLHPLFSVYRGKPWKLLSFAHRGRKDTFLLEAAAPE